MIAENKKSKDEETKVKLFVCHTFVVLLLLLWVFFGFFVFCFFQLYELITYKLKTC